MNDISRCFGIGCPIREECARFAAEKNKKSGPYILERYDFITGRCYGIVEREGERADHRD